MQGGWADQGLAMTDAGGADRRERIATASAGEGCLENTVWGEGLEGGGDGEEGE